MNYKKLLPAVLLAVSLCGCGGSNHNSSIDQGFEDHFLPKFKAECVRGCNTSCNQATDDKQPAVCQAQCESNCQCASDAYHKQFEGQSFIKMTEISQDPLKASDIIQACLAKQK